MTQSVEAQQTVLLKMEKLAHLLGKYAKENNQSFDQLAANLGVDHLETEKVNLYNAIAQAMESLDTIHRGFQIAAIEQGLKFNDQVSGGTDKRPPQAIVEWLSTFS